MRDEQFGRQILTEKILLHLLNFDSFSQISFLFGMKCHTEVWQM